MEPWGRWGPMGWRVSHPHKTSAQEEMVRGLGSAVGALGSHREGTYSHCTSRFGPLPHRLPGERCAESLRRWAECSFGLQLHRWNGWVGMAPYALR
eukprot:scaffold127187_cov29-Tisochrysis_lutea.AAC.2